MTLTPISVVQGSGAASPLAGTRVTVEGVVTADLRGPERFGGFFMQDPRGDGNPATSDGVFVEVPGVAPALKAGDVVRVTGVVRELGGFGGAPSLTEVDSPAAPTVCSSGAAIVPQRVSLPVASLESFEALEGMLVSLPDNLAVTEVYNLGRYGEVVVAPERLYIPTNGDYPDSTPEAVAVRKLIVDDTLNKQNPSPTPYLFGGSGSEATVRVGDRVSGLTGLLSFGFGNYRLQPTAAPTFTRANPRPAVPQVGGSVRVSSFNVLNYFTTLQTGVRESRGARSEEEFKRQQAKLVAAMRAIDADLYGLTEIENNGDTAMASLTGALNAAVGSQAYSFVKDPASGTGTDLIKVGFIYRTSSLTPVGAAKSDPKDYYYRFPVAQTFRAANGGVFTAVVNHFKSRAGCPSSGATQADAPDADWGQGCWNGTRTRAATALAAFAASVAQAAGDPDVLLMGDLNAYTREDPLQVMAKAGFEVLTERVPAAQRYSYVFMGQAGFLDHALASTSLAGQVTGIAPWHINADEPPVLDYSTSFKTDDRYAPTPYRSSDHDPIIVGLNLTPGR
ncbi:MAG TPA: ExeM/NucH family extracellular endonuclease [Deinococcales bacterium]|nr:ExeM/NucH family extracellular endonuclease [Deinococcales bacterium]